MQRVRVATLQYFIRPVESVDQFQQQVAALVETAADYECGLVLFPEYFTIQLLTLGNVRRPIREQVRDLAAHREMFVDFMSGLGRQRPRRAARVRDGIRQDGGGDLLRR